MASLLVSPLLEVVLDKLASGLCKELRLLGGLEKDVRKLQSTLSAIKAVIEDAEQRSNSDKSLLDWLKKLKDAAYDADDAVDELQIEALRAKAHGDQKQEVIDFFSSHNPIVFRRKISQKIKDVSERLNEIAEERTKFHLAQVSAPVRTKNEETHSVVIASEIYGRDEDKEMILNYLLNEGTDNVLSVISIVGLGGLGKTTLAQLVYNDERIKSSFNPKVWVCVSDQFDVKVIARKIVQCIRKEAKCNHLDLDPLGQLLRETLGGKRFIIVLDDVWNEDAQKWESLKSLLSCGEKGSKVVVTTRNEDVARAMDSVLLHRLACLSANDCWKLFRERAFGLGREEETPRLIEIGKEIVNKGGGLPLATKALGSLMGSKRGEREWLAIENSEIWRLGDDENEILPALQLSYFGLPPHVRRCFVYCSLFHKNFVFNKEKLIRLWLGDGLIQSSSEGSKYFNSLSRRSFFDQVAEEVHCPIELYYKIEEYTMHDLIHDLALNAGKGEYCIMEEVQKKVKVLGNCRYLSLNMNDDMSAGSLRFSYETKKLRSLLLIRNPEQITEIDWDTLLQLNRIRSLDLSSSNISMLPSTLFKFKHLRFIDLSYTYIKALPSTISNIYNLCTLILARCSKLRELPSTLLSLSNLSTLDLHHCYELRELPSGMSKMNNLIHLDIRGCYGLREMPPGMGRLTSLETMSRFVVGEKDGCSIRELKHLNQIGGRLEISSLYRVKSPTEAKEANLRAKINIKELWLDWGTPTGAEMRRDTTAVGDENVIENLQPPSDLEGLSICNYNGVRLPSWLVTGGDSSSESMLFRNLVSLILQNLTSYEGLPPLGQLHLLKRLSIGGIDGVRRIGGQEFYGCTEAGGTSPFPKLEILELEYMCNLEEWVVEAGVIARESMFPSLRKLYIRQCPKLRVVRPGLPTSLVDLSVYGKTEMSAGCFAGLTRLQSLSICMSVALVEGGLRYLTALERLEIRDTYDGPTTCLSDGMIQCHIPSLRTLRMFSFRSLTSLGQQQLTYPPPLFTSLCNLDLNLLEALTVLPDWIGFGCLTSLQSLGLGNCPKLEMLPDELQHHTTLQHLRIDRCPLVERRCVRETGEDWHKIAHIPHIWISEGP